MRNIRMTMSRMQMNSKFVNNMLPEWGRFVTTVKLNKGLRDSNYDQLYAYLKQHKARANENKIMLERFTQPNFDLLALYNQGNLSAYILQDIGHIAKNYTQPKPPQNSQIHQRQDEQMQSQANGYH
ncbi:hypothetical protein Tco_1173415 [Tanacetum coccineum]